MNKISNVMEKNANLESEIVSYLSKFVKKYKHKLQNILPWQSKLESKDANLDKKVGDLMAMDSELTKKNEDLEEKVNALMEKPTTKVCS